MVIAKGEIQKIVDDLPAQVDLEELHYPLTSGKSLRSKKHKWPRAR